MVVLGEGRRDMGKGMCANEGLQSQKYHLENPYWKTFDPYVIPLLEEPMDLRRLGELC